MTEQEMLKKIKKSAEAVEIPNALKPEEVKKMLDRKIEETPSIKWLEEDEGPSGQEKNQRKSFVTRTGKSLWKSVAAAVIVLAVGVSAAGVWHFNRMNGGIAGSGGLTEEKVQQAADDGSGNYMEAAAEGTEEAETRVAAPKQDAGTLYTVAKSYEEVYALLDYDWNAAGIYGAGERMDGFVEDYKYDVMKAESADSITTADYSTTNLQTEGVDEGDIVKTNEKYIFTVSGDKVVITDVQGEKMKIAGKIDPGLDLAVDNMLDMYVDNERLVLIVQHNETALQEKQFYENEETKDFTESAESSLLLLEDYASVDIAYAVSGKYSTRLYTYDISAPEKPKLLGMTEQDGYYETSRKIGNIVYLFTHEDLGNAGCQATAEERTQGGLLPLVNGDEIPYSCIYLPEQGTMSLLVTSVDLENPDRILDKVMIVNNYYVGIYVGTSALYLYNTDYQESETVTQLAKFNLDGGVINAEGAVSVKGYINDSFAINESGGKLRILTTGYDKEKGVETSRLFLFNENLELTGTLDGIADGEQIYAARYLGDIVYFITYRNIDPLFAVDLTDETNPKLLGNLEVTGFSEYLHPWGEDMLLGIGWETDPDTGVQEGIKLIMFDISNPAELKELDSIVLEDAYYSAAIYNYKSVLAEKNANIICFTVNAYNTENQDSQKAGSYYEPENRCLVYSWEDGHFVNELTESLGNDFISEQYRGIYIGERFYIAYAHKIICYDRADAYKRLDEISLN